MKGAKTKRTKKERWYRDKLAVLSKVGCYTRTSAEGSQHIQAMWRGNRLVKAQID